MIGVLCDSVYIVTMCRQNVSHCIFELPAVLVYRPENTQKNSLVHDMLNRTETNRRASETNPMGAKPGPLDWMLLEKSLQHIVRRGTTVQGNTLLDWTPWNVRETFKASSQKGLAID